MLRWGNKSLLKIRSGFDSRWSYQPTRACEASAKLQIHPHGVSLVGRISVSKTEGRGFESLTPCTKKSG